MATDGARVITNDNPLFQTNKDGSSKYIKQMSTAENGGSEYFKYDATSQIIRGTISFSKDKLRELDPSYTGYTHIFVLRMPEFLKRLADGKIVKSADGSIPDAVKKSAQYHYKNLKAMIEMASTSYSGTPDLTLNTAEINVGWDERNYDVPTTSAYNSKDFTIKCLETKREPLRRACEFYINAITDATAKATFLGGAANDDGTPLQYSLAVTTFAIMVVQTDSSLLNIQDVSIWNNAFFTNVPRNQLDWDNGEVNIVQPTDMSWHGIYMPDANNVEIHKIANKLMAERVKYFKRIQDLTSSELGIDSWDVG